MRRASFKILYDVFFKDVLLNDAINIYFNATSFREDDKAFIKREVTGTIEKIDEIDKLISKYSKVKLNKLNKDILTILRLGIYELKFMDKVPAYATINEYVNIIKKTKSKMLSGYVNAILRNVYRNEKIDVDIVSDDIVKVNQNIRKNCYFKIYNNKDKDVLKELIDKNIIYREYEGNLDFKYTKVYSVNKYKNILETESFVDGNVFIEDASSIYMVDRLAELVAISKYNTISVLDTCSSPGGKTFSLIDVLLKINVDMKINAVLCDISDEKLSKIKDNIHRLKCDKKKNITIDIIKKDATCFDNDFTNRFDVVICDVPCTGLGVINKKPDIKLNYTDEKRNSLVKIQRQILNVSKKYLKSGGILSYSTCTTTKEENVLNIKYFIENNKDFNIIFEKQIELYDENNADGFYMCFMKKND